MAAPAPAASPSRGARLGKRIGQIVFFSVLVWIVVSGAAQVLGETVFNARVAHDAADCRSSLGELRVHLAEALRHHEGQGELAVVSAFRSTLGGEAGRAWDLRAMELIDGCPAAESAAARALYRLRAADEGLVRIDAQLGAPARAEHDATLAAITEASATPSPRPAAAPAAPR